jgi:hypothetical protein
MSSQSSRQLCVTSVDNVRLRATDYELWKKRWHALDSSMSCDSHTTRSIMSYSRSVEQMKRIWVESQRSGRYFCGSCYRRYPRRLTVKADPDQLDAIQILYNRQSTYLDATRKEMIRLNPACSWRLVEAPCHNVATITAVTDGYKKHANRVFHNPFSWSI